MEHKYKSAKSFIGIFYEDNPIHRAALMKLKKFENVCWVYHDKDVDDNGEPKKPHWHYIIKFPVRRTIQNVAGYFNHDDVNLIQTCGNETIQLRYLIHLDDKDKYQYCYDDVDGNGGLYKRFCLVVNEDTEDDRVSKLIGFIESCETKLTMTEFVKIVCEIGLYPEMRRASQLFTLILREHNSGRSFDS